MWVDPNSRWYHLLLNEISLGSVNVFEGLSHENTHYPAGCCTSNLRPPSIKINDVKSFIPALHEKIMLPY